MKPADRMGHCRGQALVEFVTVLPVLILFISTVAPLVMEGTAVTWLDERLALRQLLHENKQIPRILYNSHENSHVPRYFDNSGIEEATRSLSLAPQIYISGITFPGSLIRKFIKTTTPGYGWRDPALTPGPKLADQRFQGTLDMIQAPEPDESLVAGKIKSISALGIVKGLTGILEKVGFNLFHLNLEALPETCGREKKR